MNPLQSYPRPDNGRRQIMIVGQDKAKLVRLSVSPRNAKIYRGHKTDPSTGCMFGSTVGLLDEGMPTANCTYSYVVQNPKIQVRVIIQIASWSHVGIEKQDGLGIRPSQGFETLQRAPSWFRWESRVSTVRREFESPGHVVRLIDRFVNRFGQQHMLGVGVPREREMTAGAVNAICCIRPCWVHAGSYCVHGGVTKRYVSLS
jgi:hypothetical protein